MDGERRRLETWVGRDTPALVEHRRTSRSVTVECCVTDIARVDALKHSLQADSHGEERGRSAIFGHF